MRVSRGTAGAVLLGAALLAAGCSMAFTEQVRGAGLRYESPPPAAAGAAPGAPAGPGRMRRSFGGHLAQALLPVALILDAAVSLLEVVDLAATVASWSVLIH